MPQASTLPPITVVLRVLSGQITVMTVEYDSDSNPPRLVANASQALDLVKGDGLLLAHVVDYQLHKQVVEAAIRQNGLALEFAPKFHTDHEMALVAVRQTGLALQHVGRSIQNAHIVLEAVKQNGLALKFAPISMLSDHNLVTAAVANNGDAIRFAAPLLKDRFPIAKIAVEQQPLALEYLSDRLKDHVELLNEAAYTYAGGLLSRSAHLDADDEFLLAIRTALKDASARRRGGRAQASSPPPAPQGSTIALQGGSRRLHHVASSASLEPRDPLLPVDSEVARGSSSDLEGDDGEARSLEARALDRRAMQLLAGSLAHASSLQAYQPPSGPTVHFTGPARRLESPEAHDALTGNNLAFRGTAVQLASLEAEQSFSGPAKLVGGAKALGGLGIFKASRGPAERGVSLDPDEGNGHVPQGFASAWRDGSVRLHVVASPVAMEQVPTAAAASTSDTPQPHSASGKTSAKKKVLDEAARSYKRIRDSKRVSFWLQTLKLRKALRKEALEHCETFPRNVPEVEWCSDRQMAEDRFDDADGLVGEARRELYKARARRWPSSRLARLLMDYGVM